MNTTVPQKQHSDHGASKAARWMACPGSIALEAKFPDLKTDFAAEGTAAHAVAEMCLTRKVDAETFVGTTVEGIEITEDMIPAIDVYVNFVREKMEEWDKYWIEKQFTLKRIKPPVPMYGTADACGVAIAARHLDVVDLKFGQGVSVEATGNKQGRYYALGALLEIEEDMPGVEIDDITIWIVQPRTGHADGPIRSETLSYEELLGFANDLIAAGLATMQPNAPRIPGGHCRFCRAEGICAERAQQAQDVALVEFSALPEHIPPAPDVLPPADFEAMLGKLHILETWCKAMRMHALNMLSRGEPVAGFKLVEKRAMRRWPDEEKIAAHFAAFGDDIFDRKLKSPAAMERLLGKKNVPAELWVKQSSGVTMAPVHDPRPAFVVAPGVDFNVLTSGED